MALQIGHRQSVDIDLFGPIEATHEELTEALCQITTVTTLRNSPKIHLYLMDGIKVDLVDYRYQWLAPEMEEEGVRLASIEDIAAMKIAAVVGRGTRKDFIDIAALLERYSLEELLCFYEQKYPDASSFIALKSLAYFDDAESDPMPRMFTSARWPQVKTLIQSHLKQYTLGSR